MEGIVTAMRVGRREGGREGGEESLGPLSSVIAAVEVCQTRREDDKWWQLRSQ